MEWRFVEKFMPNIKRERSTCSKKYPSINIQKGLNLQRFSGLIFCPWHNRRDQSDCINNGILQGWKKTKRHRVVADAFLVRGLYTHKPLEVKFHFDNQLPIYSFNILL